MSAKRMFHVDIPEKDPPYEYKTRHYLGEDARRFNHDEEEVDGWIEIFADRSVGSTFAIFRRVKP